MPPTTTTVSYIIPGQHGRSVYQPALNNSTEHLFPASDLYIKGDNRDPHTVMKRLTHGVVQHQIKPESHPEKVYQKLSRGPNPHTIFIGCSDSPTDPGYLTNTLPGELFTIRNTGNILPMAQTAQAGFNSELAGLTHATNNFDTQCVVVCGHTGCGAIKSAMNLNTIKDPVLFRWLLQLKPLVDKIKLSNPKQAEHFLQNEIARWNVVQQVHQVRNTLLQVPGKVSDRLRNGSLQVVGWFYDFNNECVEQFDPILQRFIPIGLSNTKHNKV